MRTYYYRCLNENEDCDEAVKVVRRSFSTVRDDLGIESEVFPAFAAFYTLQKMKRELRDGAVFVGAYEAATHVLTGLVGIQKKDDGKGKILHLAVLPDYRHEGIGRRLMFEAECIALNYGIHKLELGYVHENMKVGEFYTALGYKVDKTRKYKQTGFSVSVGHVRIDHLYGIVERYGYVDVMGIARNQYMMDGQDRLLLIYSMEEVLRETNTGYLVQKAFGDAISEFIWRRGQDKLLEAYIKRLGTDLEPVLVYMREGSQDADEWMTENNDRSKLFIVIDSTWQEARRILNQSDYLKSLKSITIKAAAKSTYKLRRNQVDGGLCTAETAGELFRHCMSVEMYEEYGTMSEVATLR